MKRLINASSITTILLAMVSLNTSAAVKCQPLVQQMNLQEQLVSDFSYTVLKEQKKLQRIENKIYEKRSQLNQIQSEVDAEKNIIQMKNQDKQSIINSIQSLENQKQSLQIEVGAMMSQMQQLTSEMQNLPARSTALRNLLREKKRTEKKMELKQALVYSLDEQMAPAIQSINTIESSIMNSQSKIQALKQEKKALRAQQPTIQNLKQRKADAEQILSSQNLIQDDNMSYLAVLTEKVDVCKTYKVKYPLSLQIAKEIYEVGCDQYRVQNFQNIYKQQAEQETMNMLCGSDS